MRIRGVLVLAVLAVAALPAAAGSAAVMCNGVPATRVGTPGPDTLYGTDFNDVIAGLGGNDTIYGYKGDDIICGGDGNDTIWAGEGTNRVWGDAGNDVISGGSAFDTFYGGPGNDVLDPGEGAVSRLYGQGGADRILLRRVVGGDDQLVDGGAGRDILDLRNAPAATTSFVGPWVEVNLDLPGTPYFGVKAMVGVVATFTSAGSGTGIESVYGTLGADLLSGDDRSNVLRGEGGDDYLWGNGGNDRLIGGTGSDGIFGGAGTDTCVAEVTSQCE